MTLADLKQAGLLGADAQAYRYGGCMVIVSALEHRGDGKPRRHLSISHPSRYPTWDEIHGARDRYLPAEATFAMLLPPPEEYVNVHPNCFHLWELLPGECGVPVRLVMP